MEILIAARTQYTGSGISCGYNLFYLATINGILVKIGYVTPTAAEFNGVASISATVVPW